MSNNIAEVSPTYATHKDGDWSAVYYGESIEKYLPSSKNIERRTGHWFFEFICTEHSVEFDFHVLYIIEDMKKLNMLDHVHFGNPRKPSLPTIWKRILKIKSFRKFFPLDAIFIKEFLLLPTYNRIRIH